MVGRVNIHDEVLTTDEVQRLESALVELNLSVFCPHTGNLLKLSQGFNTASGTNWLPKEKIPSPLRKILKYVNHNYIGVEWWIGSHFVEDTGLTRHSDVDEKIYKLTGEKVHPEVTLVFYSDIDELEGGELVLYNGESDGSIEKIKPKKNRLIIFDARIEHEVLPFTGIRTSYIFNPWKEKPLNNKDERAW